jgi:hypothetical protein
VALIDFEPLDRGTLRMTTSASMTLEQVLHALRDDADFRTGWTEALAGLSFAAFRWETPATTDATLAKPFEAVVVDSPSLGRPQSPSAFAEHFEAEPEADVITVPNLGGDAMLVIPSPRSEAECYGHLAAFLRGSPPGQADALWRQVADETLDMVGERALWLSTAGGGVPWLHVRLDRRPKYYAHAPYR